MNVGTFFIEYKKRAMSKAINQTFHSIDFADLSEDPKLEIRLK